MTKKGEPLSKEDPRFYAIDNFNDGLAMLATTEFVENIYLSFGLPSSTALFLNLANQAMRKIKDFKIEDCFQSYPQGTWPENHSGLFNFFELMITQIVFSYTAIETFVNVTIHNNAPVDHVFLYPRNKNKKLTSCKKEEAEKLNLKIKLDHILPGLLGLSTPKGNKIWSNFRICEELRDRIIHLKSIDMRASGPEKNTLWGDLIRKKNIDFPRIAIDIIGYFYPTEKRSRWYKEFPYAT
ncbi:hypothetical protein SE938_16050 [Legionella pneumophila]|uniref:hypothetical protein n=1 Tax=Legionella pneumophila TaxID=446 RepID=UPI00077082EA|nr:hypothetical protein [Legionella pneumophila]MDW9138074.1 hypothetical protein [Legionella pneumophila]MDW9144268.1 hypothetical protein [Legionella pneumophila]MDW9162965.1 hypothetical protein [Legionella pneumophila]CZG49121.1 Uncharacterised protein [Legionella pneumophila]